MRIIFRLSKQETGFQMSNERLAAIEAQAEALSALAGVLDTEPVVFDGAPPQRTPHPRAHYHRWRLGSDEYVYHAHPEERDFPGHKHFHLDGHAMYYVPLAAADPPPASEPDDDEQFAPGSGGWDLR
jgi:hypothetical protein